MNGDDRQDENHADEKRQVTDVPAVMGGVMAPASAAAMSTSIVSMY